MVDAPSTSDLRAALDDVALLGPFYAATANPAEVVDDSWRPLRALYTDPEPLATRIDQVAVALGTEDQRVAASITYQGLAARLVSPLIALAAVHGLTATWSPDTLHWRRAVTGPWPLWESDERPRAPLAVELPDAVAEALVEPHLVALAVAVRAQVAVSERTLRGNAASAVVAAGRLVARSRPGYSSAAWIVVRHLLGTDGLADSGVFTTGWGFRRRSCCLYYRVPGGGVCGDCVLTGRQ
ncbi:MAG TPA: (2Fe-2S)-binding protein [Pseudonocardia sp.]|jgi:ferric iron reductase protein FhuF|uniref:(2Fe-2S)-binding protein n=1 Tax=Pseudonocardia sp. TaxID=60912 RepID=UPI002F3F7EB5